MVQNLGLEFPILYNPAKDVVKNYEVYNSSNGYAIPSVFIVDTDGVIRWEFSGSTSHRADNNEIIAQLKELS